MKTNKSSYLYFVAGKLQMKAHTDEELISLIQHDDPYAFRELYERYWEKLFIAALKKMASEDDACDLLQNIFFSIWKRRKKIGNIVSVNAYLFAILRFELHSYYKAKEKEQLRELNFPFDEVLENPVIDMMSQKELKEIIDAEIGCMSKRMRETFLLSRENGLSAAEIAAKQSVSVQTVRNQISGALKRIRLRIASVQKESSPPQ